jgi:adenylate cyclase class IV
MPRNVEIKVRVADLAPIEARARTLATEGPIDLVQDDTFFGCIQGRLKLREFAGGQGELIHYVRADDSAPKPSDYLIVPVAATAALREALSRALGSTGRVRKARRVYILDRTRVHLDAVENLGSFVELEVVLREGESAESGTTTALRVMADLGISEFRPLPGSYLDLLREPA